MARLWHLNDHQQPRNLAGAPHRLCLRHPLRHCVPVFQHRTHVRRLLGADHDARSQSGYPEPDEFRSGSVWLDDRVSGGHLGLPVADEQLGILVDDAGGDASGVWDGGPGELVVDRQRDQGALCLTVNRYPAP